MGEVPLYQAEASRGGVSPVRPGEDSLLSSSSPLFSLSSPPHKHTLSHTHPLSLSPSRPLSLSISLSLSLAARDGVGQNSSNSSSPARTGQIVCERECERERECVCVGESVCVRERVC